MSTKLSQGRQLIDRLKRVRVPHTYMDLLDLRISTCPHKRIVEALREGECIVKGKRWMGGKKYLVTWSVVVAKKASNAK